MRIIQSSSSKHTTYHLPLLLTQKRCPRHHRRIYRSASFDPEARGLVPISAIGDSQRPEIVSQRLKIVWLP